MTEVIEMIKLVGENVLQISMKSAVGGYEGEIFSRLERFGRLRSERFLGITAVGTTLHERRAAPQIIEKQLADVILVRYNPARPSARYDLFPLVPFVKTPTKPLLLCFKSASGAIFGERCQELGLSQEHWWPRAADYYRFVLTRPQLDGFLCALNTPSEVFALSAALQEPPLEEDEEKYLIDLGRLAIGRSTALPAPIKRRSLR